MKNVNKFVYDRTLTYLQKNRDYGNSVDKTRLILGEKADLVRMADKIHRIEHLALKQNEPKVAESIEDTILDLIIYMAIWESGIDRTDIECCTSTSRLIELIECLDCTAQHPKDALEELQNDIGKEILNDFTLDYIANFIESMTA